MRTIGLTGGIGSGKTTVAHILEELGAFVIDADAVGHEIYRPNTEGWRAVVHAFGSGILQPNQAIDRRHLGALVFDNPEALTRLNTIVHPLMFREIERRIAAHRLGHPAQPIVLEAAVLIEAKWVPLVDQVWLVLASKEDAIDRVRRARGLDRGAALKRIEAQMSDAERRRYAAVVIENTGSLDALRARVREEWDRLSAARC